MSVTYVQTAYVSVCHVSCKKNLIIQLITTPTPKMVVIHWSMVRYISSRPHTPIDDSAIDVGHQWIALCFFFFLFFSFLCIFLFFKSSLFLGGLWCQDIRTNGIVATCARDTLGHSNILIQDPSFGKHLTIQS